MINFFYASHKCFFHTTEVFYKILYRKDVYREDDLVYSIYYDDKIPLINQINPYFEKTYLITKVGRIYLEFKFQNYERVYSIKIDPDDECKLDPSLPMFVKNTTIAIVNLVLKTHFKSIENNQIFNMIRQENSVILGECYSE